MFALPDKHRMYISTSALFRSKSKHMQFQNRFSWGSIPGGLRNMEPKRPYIVWLCLKCKGLFFFDPLSSRQNMGMFINAKWLTSRAKLAGQARLCTKTSFIWNSSLTRKAFSFVPKWKRFVAESMWSDCFGCL